MIVSGMFVCSSFLISVCMFIMSKALQLWSATVIVRAEGAIWLNPFATVLFSVCSAVTLECCVFYPCIHFNQDCCCLPTPMTFASGGSPIFPHVVHQPASQSIWPAVR